MKFSFEQDLQKLGFSDKETKVYLAALELGPSSAQILSEKAGVNRATTYVMIESLTSRGLISSFKKGKKTLFLAESPEHLKHFVERELDSAKLKKDLVTDLIPQLGSLIFSVKEKPQITMYEGLQGLKEIHQDILTFGKKVKMIDNIAAIGDIRDQLSTKDLEVHWDEMASHEIKVRALYTKNGEDERVPKRFRHLWQERRISDKKFPFHGEIVIYGDRVAALAFKGKIVGAVIESAEIAQTLRVLFELAWIGSKELEI